MYYSHFNIEDKEKHVYNVTVKIYIHNIKCRNIIIILIACKINSEITIVYKYNY